MNASKEREPTNACFEGFELQLGTQNPKNNKRKTVPLGDVLHRKDASGVIIKVVGIAGVCKRFMREAHGSTDPLPCHLMASLIPAPVLNYRSPITTLSLSGILFPPGHFSLLEESCGQRQFSSCCFRDFLLNRTLIANANIGFH